MRKKVIGILVMMLLILSVVLPVTSSLDIKNESLDLENNSNTCSLSSDDWTSFHHDMRNTGYSSDNGPTHPLIAKWTYEVATSARVTSSPVVCNDRVYIAAKMLQSDEVYLYCFDSENGGNGPIWSESLGVWEDISSPAIDDCDEDETMEIYIKCSDHDTGILYCYDIDGNYEWEVTIGASTSLIQSSPSIYMGEAPEPVIFVGRDLVDEGEDGIFGINGFGQVMWSKEIPHVSSTVAIANGDHDAEMEIYFGGSSYGKDATVYCLNRFTGDIEWATNFYGAEFACFSSPAVGDGDLDKQEEVYIVQASTGSGDDGYIYCLDASNGVEEWRKPLGCDCYHSSPALADGDGDNKLEIYIGTSCGYTMCLDPTNFGQYVWSFHPGTTSHVHNSPAVSSNGFVYVGYFGGDIYCLDGANGDEIAYYCAGGHTYSSPAIYDGKLYIGSWNGHVNCLETDSQVPSDLSCTGTLDWSDVTPGDSVVGYLEISNIGEGGSNLNWQIAEYPDWGRWTADPNSGAYLQPEDGPVEVEVEVEAPDEKEKEFKGDIKIINLDDPDDYEIVPVTLATPKNKEKIISQPLLRILQNFPAIYKILQRFLTL